MIFATHIKFKGVFGSLKANIKDFWKTGKNGLKLFMANSTPTDKKILTLNSNNFTPQTKSESQIYIYWIMYQSDIHYLEPLFFLYE